MGRFKDLDILKQDIILERQKNREDMLKEYESLTKEETIEYEKWLDEVAEANNKRTKRYGENMQKSFQDSL